MKYKLAVFDLDGTILNTLDDLAVSLNFSLEKNELPLHTKDEVRFMVGNGIPKLIIRAIPSYADEKLQSETYGKVLQDFLEHYHSHSMDHTKPYEGITQCLQRLKGDGVILAVNTNKVETASVELCNHFFPGIFDFISGGKEEHRPKPESDGILEILEKAGLKELYLNGKGKAVFIGDSDVDIQTGNKAGFDTVGVDWGFRGKKFLQENGAYIVAMTPDELYKILAE